MTGDSSFSPTGDDALSPDPNLHITIEDVSQNSENLLEDEGNGLENGCEELFEIEDDDDRIGRSDQYFDIETNDHEDQTNDDDPNEHLFDIDGDETNDPFFEIEEDGTHEDVKDDPGTFDSAQIGTSCPEPAVGSEFDTYDDAYNFYNSYAKEIGFAIRVKSSWTKRNSKEKRGAVLCCNCEGFKTVKEANSRRKETRTGCLAMVRLRLVDSNRWRIDEVRLEHNHLFDPERAQNSKSHKRVDSGTKRRAEPALDVEVRTIKLYRASGLDPVGHGTSNSFRGESNGRTHWSNSKHLKLKTGDAQIINSFFSRAQLMDPNFFYAMDFSDEGTLRNVFWIGSRSRAAYGYFGDAVSFDANCLSYGYETPLVEFVGVNHHGERVPLGCGLLSDESSETYVWLLRAWLTCLAGRPPQTIVTSHCKALRAAVSEVFPRAHHRARPSGVVRTVLESLLGLQDYEAFRTVLLGAVYDTVKADEFELAWDDMIRRFGITNVEWLRSLYEDRERWAPVYSRDTFFAGVSGFQRGEEPTESFFRIREKTSLREFLFEIHDSALEEQRRREALEDLVSKSGLSQTLGTRSYFELQLSQLYTRAVFEKFQAEVISMPLCFGVTQLQTNGPVSTFAVRENGGEEIPSKRSFEVIFEKGGSEVRCNCGCFGLKGYLCRHALCVLSYNGVEEIPFQYILARWRRDFKRLYVPDLGSNNNVDIANPVQWFDHLYRRAMQVVEEGMGSQEHYMVGWQVFKESLNKVRLVADNKHV